MLEVKRKPDESRSTRGVAGTATARAYQPSFTHKNNDPTGFNAAEIVPQIDPEDVPTLVPEPHQKRISQTRMPVITGEANYKGMLPVDGVLAGQLGGNGGSLSVRQKSGSSYSSQPELCGEISFRDMLRVNGHIAGTVYSKIGTLIVDASAKVDANIEVGTAIISGIVCGDIVAQQKVELGPCAKIYGNIWTRSLAIKDGAVFDGIVTMIGG